MHTLMQENEFLAPPRWWECASNWLTKDNSPAEHPPCGDDNAVFEEVGISCITWGQDVHVHVLVNVLLYVSSIVCISGTSWNCSNLVCVSCTCTPFGQLQLVTTDVLLFMASPIIDQVVIVAGVNFLRES